MAAYVDTRTQLFGELGAMVTEKPGGVATK
jgi:hypothetical protein